MEYTDEQREASLLDSDRILIESLAGTGKTETVALMIEERIKKGVKPEEILCVTFTNSAVNQLKSRLQSKGIEVNVQTIDSYAYSVVREYFDETGRELYIADQESIARELLLEYGLRASKGDINAFNNLSILNWFGGDISTFKGLPGVDGEDIVVLLKEYDKRKRLFESYDFVDLSFIASEVNKREYREVIIDEAQDSNPAHIKLIETFSNAKLVFVGDEYQSIYGFAGVNPNLLSEYCKDWEKGTLTKSFRSNEKVLEVVNSVFDNGLKLVGGREGGTVMNSGNVFDILGRLVESEGSKALLSRTRYDLMPVVKSLETFGVKVGKSWERDNHTLFEFYASTVHSSKGLEFDSVGIFDLSKTGFKNFDNDDIMSDRLAYVASSRSRNNLFLHTFDGGFPFRVIGEDGRKKE